MTRKEKRTSGSIWIRGTRLDIVGAASVQTIDTFERQVLLHKTAGLCSLGLLLLNHAEYAGPLLGEDFDEGALRERLRPGLDLVWPDRPDAPEGVEAFLREAHRRAVAGLHDLVDEEGFIPAGLWDAHDRELLLEHLRQEVDALVGGVQTEEIWHGFGGVPATEAIPELVASGVMIKLRSVGTFLVGAPSRYDDELTAADFFPVNIWERERTQAIAAHVISNQSRIHKQIAHLTVTRPFPGETWVYRPSSYMDLVTELITLLEDFTRFVDQRLLPEWWGEWVDRLGPRLLPPGFEESGLHPDN